MSKQDLIIKQQGALSSDAATPAAGYLSLYPKTDGKWYSIDSSGNIVPISNTAGSITNSMLAGSIAYSKLSLTGAILNADLAGSIADGKLASSYLYADGTRPLTGNWNMGAFNATFTKTGATAATIYDAFVLTNTTVASSGNQMYSPAIHWTGQGWKTTATAASQSVDFKSYVIPVQGAANPTGVLVFDYSINGAGYANLFNLNSVGNASLGVSINSAYTLAVGSAGTSGGIYSPGGSSSVAYWLPNGTAIRTTTTGGNLYIDAGTDLGGTIHLRGSAISLEGTVSLTSISSTGSIINTSTNSIVQSKGSGLPGIRLTNTGAGGKDWGIESARNAAAGSFEINNVTDDLTNPKLVILAGGRVGISVVAPTAMLHLKAGTATASTAPLKLTAGTLLATPELGAIEFTDNGTTGHLYITLNQAGVLTRVQII